MYSSCNPDRNRIVIKIVHLQMQNTFIQIHNLIIKKKQIFLKFCICPFALHEFLPSFPLLFLSSFSLQHAWLHGQENAGGLMCCCRGRFQHFHMPNNPSAFCHCLPFISFTSCVVSQLSSQNSFLILEDKFGGIQLFSPSVVLPLMATVNKINDSACHTCFPPPY